MRHLNVAVLCVLLAAAAVACGGSSDPDRTPEQVAVTVAPSAVEAVGDAVLVDVTTGHKTPLEGLPEVYARGQGGLLDVAAAPGQEGEGRFDLGPRGGRHVQ